YCVISDNYLDGGVGSATYQTVAAIETENATSDQRVSDIIFERNWLRGNVKSRTLLNINARRVTVRNNVFLGMDVPNGNSFTAIDIFKRGIEPAPQDNRIYNNTCYRGTQS